MTAVPAPATQASAAQASAAQASAAQASAAQASAEPAIQAAATAADWLVAPELAPDPADPDLAPLYAAAARGVLVMPFCGDCGLPLELEQSVCDGCRAGAGAGAGAAKRQWREVPRAGTVHAATLVHRREPGLILADAPYPVVDVELASGHRLVLTTAQPSTSAPAIGAPVEIAFRTVGAVAVPAVIPPTGGSTP
jgi:uncharacterized OB-fold protein